MICQIAKERLRDTAAPSGSRTRCSLGVVSNSWNHARPIL